MYPLYRDAVELSDSVISYDCGASKAKIGGVQLNVVKKFFGSDG